MCMCIYVCVYVCMLVMSFCGSRRVIRPSVPLPLSYLSLLSQETGVYRALDGEIESLFSGDSQCGGNCVIPRILTNTQT